MENASKALLMAGGMLIALLVIGALLLAFNQIGDYEKGKSSMTKSSQVADFNKEFGKYSGDDVKGYDLITVINKAIDFNSKEGTTKETANSVDYSKKIKIVITNMKKFKNKYGVNNSSEWLKGNSDSYETQNSGDTIPNGIKKFTELERTYTLSKLSNLSSNYDSIKAGTKTVKDIIGTDDSRITLEVIAQYREYSEFKSSSFKNTDMKYNGDQIVELDFEYIE